MLNIEQLKHRIADYAHVDYQDAERFVDSLLHLIKERLDAGEEVEILGLGHFSVIDPQNEDLRRYAFVPDVKMREAVNAPFNCFDPVVIGSQEPYKENVSVPQGKDIMEEIDKHDSSVKEEVNNRNLSVTEEAIKVTDATESEVSAATEEPTAETSSDEPVAFESVIKEQETVEPASSNNVAQGQPKVADVDLDDDESDTLEEVKLKEGKTPWLLYVLIAGALVVLGYLLRLYFDYTNQNDWVSSDVTYVTDSLRDKAKTTVVQTDTLLLERDSTAAVQKETLSGAEENTDHLTDMTATAAADATSQPVKNEKPYTVDSKPSTVDSKPATIDTKPTPVETKPALAETKPASVPEEKPAPKPASHHYKLGEDGKPLTVTLQPGERLTIIALREFGDKSFWPYIYDVNSDKLTNPNNVPVGIVLKLPDPLFYGIDANNPASVNKAKNRAAQLLKK